MALSPASASESNRIQPPEARNNVTRSPLETAQSANGESDGPSLIALTDAQLQVYAAAIAAELRRRQAVTDGSQVKEVDMGSKWSELRDRTFSNEKRAKVRAETDAEVLDLNLRAVRKMAGKTQVELAKALGLSQGELSEQERRKDHLLSTLRRYIEALGGELEVIARIGDTTVRLRGV